MRLPVGPAKLVARVLLGLFVVWQIVFLWGSFFAQVEEYIRDKSSERWPQIDNYIQDWSRGKDPYHRCLDTADRKALRHYARATSQPQNWSLFAPDVAKTLSFVALELRWDDDRIEPKGPVKTYPLDPVTLRARIEPDDVNSFVRFGTFRIRRYEGRFALLPTLTDDVFDPKVEAWRDKIVDRTARDEEGDFILAYMRWRLREYLREHRDRPEPTQVILSVRAYGIPEPPGPSPWRLRYYGQQPVARWRPGAARDPDDYELERFNPLTDRYESFKR